MHCVPSNGLITDPNMCIPLEGDPIHECVPVFAVVALIVVLLGPTHQGHQNIHTGLSISYNPSLHC